jgi:hypothetical protein
MVATFYNRRASGLTIVQLYRESLILNCLCPLYLFCLMTYTRWCVGESDESNFGLYGENAALYPFVPSTCQTASLSQPFIIPSKEAP